MKTHITDRLFLSLGGLVLISAFAVSAMSREAFFTYFGAEDSLIENMTAVLLGLCGLVLILRAMAEQINFRVVWLGRFMESHFLKLSLLNNAAIVGVGYIIGVRYAAIICAGSDGENDACRRSR